MNPPRPASSRSCSLHFALAAALLLILQGASVRAEPLKSLLPAFGNDGAEFTINAKGGNVTKGWLPKEWTDNSEWASVSATYTKLADSPDKDAGAVRIKIEKVEDGQLQFTTYGGMQKYQKGSHYVVNGWVRSPDRLTVKVGARQTADPYEMYYEQDMTTDPEWKQFEFVFTPAMDISAFVMFIVHDVGTVDLAGITVVEKP